MKKYIWRFLFIIFTFVNIVFAYGETITLDWLNEDGTTNNTTTCTIGGDLQVPIPTKTGYDFVGWAANRIIEYLEINGTQYIDTGVVPTVANKTKVTLKIMPTFVSTGTVASGSSNNINYAIKNGLWRLNGVDLMAANTTDIKTIILQQTNNGRYYSIDSTTGYGSVLTERSTFYLGRLADNVIMPQKIISVKIEEKDILVRDFIPVLDYNNVPCMYDKVTGQFFYNAGTGNFIAGPIVGDQ